MDKDTEFKNLLDEMMENMKKQTRISDAFAEISTGRISITAWMWRTATSRKRKKRSSVASMSA